MSARDRFKAANKNFVSLGSEANKETIVDDILNNLDRSEEKTTAPNPIPVEDVTPIVPKPTKLVNVMDKSTVGRPKTWGEYKNISVRLKLENYENAREICGIYGSMIGYINWLIEEDINRRNNMK